MRLFNLFSAALVCAATGQVLGTTPGRKGEGCAILKQGNEMKVCVERAKASPVQISIRDDQGDWVFDETITHQKNFIRPYDLSKLEDGQYTIVVEGNKLDYTKTFRLRAPSAPVLPAKMVTIDPGMRKYMLVVPHYGSHEITVRVYDTQHHLLRQHTQDVDSNYACLFRLKDFAPDAHAVFQLTDETGAAVTFRR